MQVGSNNPLERSPLVEAVQEYLNSLIVQKDMAYRERQQLIALLARMAMSMGYKAGMRRHVDVEGEIWDGTYMNMVYIDLPSGQVSWHIHDSELPLFSFLPPYEKDWDGHSVDEKFRRIREAVEKL